jgi:hypothetical protein
MASIKKRAQLAKAALKAYTDLKGKDEGTEPLQDRTVDLIADLLHLAASQGLEAASILRIAQSHFTHEQEVALKQATAKNI